MRINRFSRSATGAGWPRGQRFCNPLPYHLAMPPLVSAPEDLTPVEPMTSEASLYPHGASCGKCGGFFLVNPLGLYELTSGLDALLCIRCAAHALCNGDAVRNEEALSMWERSFAGAIRPGHIVPTEDDHNGTLWALRTLEKHGEDVAAWIRSAEVAR